MLRLKTLQTPERYDRGYVIILPGIEGYSWFNRRIAAGIRRAGLPYAVEIYDWTLKWPLFLYNLRGSRRHRTQAQKIAAKITDYVEQAPGRPVYLIGHSGGGAMSLLSLATLPPEVRVTRAILLGAAISPGFDVRPALSRTTDGICNVTSYGDWFFLGVGTLALGTVDGRHVPSAGMVGFSASVHQALPADRARLIEMPYRQEYLWQRNWGGHFGYTSPKFVAETLKPMLMGGEATNEM